MDTMGQLGDNPKQVLIFNFLTLKGELNYLTTEWEGMNLLAVKMEDPLLRRGTSISLGWWRRKALGSWKQFV